MESGGKTPPTVEAVLFDREVRGLFVPVWARVVLGSVGLLSLLYTSVAVVRMGESATAVLIILGFAGFVVIVNLSFLRRLRARRGVAQVGLWGSLLDVAQVAVLGVILFTFSGRMGLSPGVIFKSELPSLFATLIAVNGLALRPRYPLIVGGAVTALMAAIALSVAFDPASIYSNDPKDTFAGPALDVPQLVTTVVFLAGITAAVAFMAHVARRTIRAAIAAELENARLQRDQLQLVMREKVEALGRLVAGVSHEINNPLAVAMSGVNTQRLALQKLESRLAEDDRGGQRALGAASDALAATSDALARIQGTEQALRTFAHLDEADFQRVRLDDALAATIALLSREERAVVRLEIDPSGEAPELYAHAKELNQMLSTLIRASLDRAAEGVGTITITRIVEGGDIILRIRDDGPARDATEQLDELNVGLQPRNGRVAADFDLPVALAVAQRHGGAVALESSPPRGNTFVVRLPRGRPA